MKLSVLITGVALAGSAAVLGSHSLPLEPVAIGTTPQFMIDDYIVDNRWAVNFEDESPEMVLRVFHPPRKYEGNPVFRDGLLGAKQGNPTYSTVFRDPATGRFRMWYQVAVRLTDAELVKVEEAGGGPMYLPSAIAYAESQDGVHWKFPNLGLLSGPDSASMDTRAAGWTGSKENNLVWRGVDGAQATGAFVFQPPPDQDNGYSYAMLYLGRGGLRLVGSHDGLNWEPSSDTQVHKMHSDFPNHVVYDPVRKEYVLYCRAKDRYRAGGEGILNTGASRRIARMASPKLWTNWGEITETQNIIIPDELDNAGGYNFFYSMMTSYHAGIYWAFLNPFKWNTDIDAELAFSRDGVDFDRLPTRPKLLPLGSEGSWDSGLIFPGYQWVEVGDEWWIYYSGWDGPHGRKEQAARGEYRTGGIGLAKLRKEGFISLRGPENGGVMATRKIIWPGGQLVVNADGSRGELRVRVSDAKRKVIPGFDYQDCEVFTGDNVAHQVRWKGKNLAELAGQVIRLEFFLKEADLYTFRATGR